MLPSCSSQPLLTLRLLTRSIFPVLLVNEAALGSPPEPRQAASDFQWGANNHGTKTEARVEAGSLREAQTAAETTLQASVMNTSRYLLQDPAQGGAC